MPIGRQEVIWPEVDCFGITDQCGISHEIVDSAVKMRCGGVQIFPVLDAYQVRNFGGNTPLLCLTLVEMRQNLDGLQMVFV